MHNCAALVEYEHAGKVRKDIRGRIVLPSGTILDTLPGWNIKERVDEWHHFNPNQVAGLMMAIYSASQAAPLDQGHSQHHSESPRPTQVYHDSQRCHEPSHSTQVYQYGSSRELDIVAHRASLVKEIESIDAHISKRREAAAAYNASKYPRPSLHSTSRQLYLPSHAYDIPPHMTSPSQPSEHAWEVCSSRHYAPAHCAESTVTAADDINNEARSLGRSAYIEEVSEEDEGQEREDEGFVEDSREVFVATRVDHARVRGERQAEAEREPPAKSTGKRVEREQDQGKDQARSQFQPNPQSKSTLPPQKSRKPWILLLVLPLLLLVMNSLSSYYSIILLSFPFFSFSFGIYLTSCSNRTLGPAYSRP